MQSCVWYFTICNPAKLSQASSTPYCGINRDLTKAHGSRRCVQQSRHVNSKYKLPRAASGSTRLNYSVHSTVTQHKAMSQCTNQHYNIHSNRDLAKAATQQKTTPAQQAVRQVATLLAPLLIFSSSCAAADVPPSPAVGSCTDCIGELNGTLNACTLSSASCVSSQNEDEDHFMAPWQYASSTEAAVDKLIAVATGGDFEPALLQQPFGISRTDAVGFIVKGFQAAVTGNRPPEKPKFQRDQSAAIAFDGTVAARHIAADASAEYVHLVFGSNAYSDGQGANVVDAEFLFLTGDNIVDLRASTRLKPTQADGKLSLSLSKGIVYDQNLAQRQLEKLRKALQWESVPVITGFDPRFNQDKPLFFEKLYQPFLRGSYKQSVVDDMQ